MSVVYIAINIHDGKMYVGRGKTMEYRRLWHEKCARNNKLICPAFHAALRKHGLNSFVWSVFFKSDDGCIVSKVEIETIAELGTKVPNGYNISDGGEGSSGFTYRHTGAAKQKMSAARSGKTYEELYGDETAARLKALTVSRLTGKVFSEETRQKIAEKARNRRHSAKTGKKISESKKNPSQETKDNLSTAAVKTWGNADTRQRRIDAAKNRPPISEETREKLRIIGRKKKPRKKKAEAAV